MSLPYFTHLFPTASTSLTSALTDKRQFSAGCAWMLSPRLTLAVFLVKGLSGQMTSLLPMHLQAAETEAASAGMAAAQAEIERLKAASAAASQEAAQQLSAQRAHSNAVAAKWRAEAEALGASVDAARAEAAAAIKRAAAAETLALDRAAELAACGAERDRALARIAFLQACLAPSCLKHSHTLVMVLMLDLLLLITRPGITLVICRLPMYTCYSNSPPAWASPLKIWVSCMQVERAALCRR